MALRFLGIDPETNGDNCPAVFLEEGNRRPAVPGMDRHRPADAGRVRQAQPDRGQ